ncbi:hypothetical protein WN944_023101 [Citrus x changshan-huyou]|uniref:Uncharacterized protein n=1 Tax=Citrus x changshan-huyou TaxID=2935761 RepID=A0AAP0N5C6_9ROSI
MPQAGVSGSASNPSQRGGRGRGGQSRGHNTGMTFVSATGDPISGLPKFTPWIVINFVVLGFLDPSELILYGIVYSWRYHTS